MGEIGQVGFVTKKQDEGSVYGKLPGRNHKDKVIFGNKLYSIIAEDRLL